MKHTITIPIVLLLVSILLYSLYPKKQKTTKVITINQIKTILIDKKPSKSTSPKPYILSEPKNGIGIGNNWRSR